MRAPFTYYGGKSRLAATIVGLIPAHRVYLEPFFGSGAVLFAKPPSPVEIVNDVDDQVVAFFRTLRTRPEELTQLCALTPHARSEFTWARTTNTSDLSDLERAHRFWVTINQSFAKTTATNTGWSVTSARNQSIPGSIRSRLGRFADCAERLASVSIENCHGPALIERLATNDTFTYVDPPYLGSTRSAGYRHELTSDTDHQALADILTTTKASILLSGYDSPLYQGLYRDWNRIDIPVTVHSSNTTNQRRARRTEVLWLNYDPPTQQHLFPQGTAA